MQGSHPKKALNPVKPTHRPGTWSLLGSEADDIWGWWLSQDVWTFVSILSLILLSPSFSVRNTLIHIFQPFTKEVKLSDHWISHQKPQSLQDTNDPLVHPIGHFTGVRGPLFSPNCSTGPLYRVRMPSLPKIILHFSFTQPWVNTGMEGSVELVKQVR